jgi:hypothetical protein
MALTVSFGLDNLYEVVRLHKPPSERNYMQNQPIENVNTAVFTPVE